MQKKGGSVGSEKVKEGDILISDYIDYYKLIKLGNGYFEIGKLDIFGEIKWSINIPEDFSEQSRFKKANKEDQEINYSFDWLHKNTNSFHSNLYITYSRSSTKRFFLPLFQIYIFNAAPLQSFP